MMKKFAVVVVLGLQALSLPVAAQPLRIGYVDVERVLRASAPAKAAGVRLEAEFGSRSRELASLRSQWRAASNRLEKEAPRLSESERQRRTRELAIRQQELDSRSRAFQDDAERRQQEEQRVVRELVDRALKQLAESGQYDLILQDNVMFYRPRVDITKKLLDTVNALK